MIFRPYQLAALEGARVELRKGARSVVIQMPTGCHARGQGILMYSGAIKLVEDIVVGDQLMGPDSTPRTVLSLARGRQEMARIVPVKGAPWVVNLDHMLTLARTERGQDGWHDMSVRDWLTLSKTGKHIRKLVRVGVDFAHQVASPITPYALGVLIGDGELRLSVAINKPDAEAMHAALAEEAAKMGIRYTLRGAIGHFAGTCGKLGSNVVHHGLARLGLRVGSGDRFIPPMYLTASREARLQLAAGLLDTDGSLSCGGYDWISKSARLASDMAYLIRSLGLAAYITPCQKFCQTGAGGTYYRVSISGECSVIPCRIPRKQAPARAQIKDALHTGFTVERLPEDDYFGFELDGDQRYLLDDFTVTHNTGKSLIFRHIIGGVTSKGKRALLLVQGQSLVRQAAKHLGTLGVSVGIEMGDDVVGPRIGAGGMIDDAPMIVVASRDSIIRRLKHYPSDFFRMIVVDEAHHITADSYLTILAHFGVSCPRRPKPGKPLDKALGKTPWNGSTILIGLTATPDRGDGGDIMQVFDVVGYDYQIPQAIEDGWLVPIEQELCTLPGLDLQKVRRTAGDLNAADIESVIRPLLEPISRDIVRVADGRPTLIYNPLVTMADATTLHLGKTPGAGKIVTITAETDERERLFKAMAAGEIWAFSSVGTLTEGVDIPCATVGAMLRFTSSRPLYAQIMGRILRPAEKLAHALNEMSSAAERRAAIAASEKPRAVMLDFAGNSGKHKLIRVVDIIGAGEEEKVQNLASGFVARGEKDPAEAIRKAKAELAEMLRKAEGSEVERILVDPFALFSVKASRDGLRRPPTPSQIEALLNAGAVDCKITSEKSREKAKNVILQRFDLISAQAMLDESSRREQARLATLRMVRRMVKAGISVEHARTCSYPAARQAIKELEALGWKSTPHWLAKHGGQPPTTEVT